MIPASDLSRIPRREAASRNAEAARYARNEYGSSSVDWMLPASARTEGRWARFTAGLVSALGARRARLAESTAAPAPLPAGVAAVHFAGEPVHAHPHAHRPHPHAIWEAHAATSLLMPGVGADETSESCTCQP